MRARRTYRAVGCNFYSALSYNDVRPHLKILRAHDVPFIRINFGELWAGASSDSGWRNYLRDKDRWYAQRDRFFSHAEEVGIGVIASMFWRIQTIPDLMLYRFGKRDALDAWGRSNSNTREFMREVTAEIVQRYRASSALWGWELGNEYNDVLNRPLWDSNGRAGRNGGPASYVRSVDPHLANGKSDLLTYPDLFSAFEDWSRVVVSEDNGRRIRSSGLAVSSTRAYSLATGKLSIPGDYDRWMSIPPNDSPAPVFENPRSAFNVISAHVYQNANVPGQWFSIPIDRRKTGPTGLVKLLVQIAQRDQRPLFLGEFGSLKGEPGQDGRAGTDSTVEGERRYFDELLKAIVSNRVDLAAVWNYGFRTPKFEDPWNIDQPGRAYQLEALAAANRALQATSFDAR